eukprot:TRINITY_DN616_c0_g1_i1.p1 TRINITY_DN616_c0_g1~~TRINITY_DN616_c0_g1_i1.p1  ORF type:complete len:352 (+),score=65.20 TRINITY_DN616_c0_g1_i1:50-1057(+)
MRVFSLCLVALLAHTGALRDFEHFPAHELESRSVSHIADVYKAWHTRQMDEAVDCRTRRFHVFSPRGGIGDSLTALTVNFRQAMLHNRLFMVDWKFHWDLGIVAPFVWDWKDAVASGLACESWHGYAEVQHGHPTDFKEGGHDVTYDDEAMLRHLLRPTKDVERLVKNAQRRMTAKLVIGLQIRYGMETDNEWRGEPRFLEAGAELKFEECARAYARDHPTPDGRYQVVLATDTESVRGRVRASFEARGVEVIEVPGEIAHVHHGGPEADIVKAFADFFTLSKVHVLFMTSWSLFGRRAAAMTLPLPQRFNISHGLCNTPGFRECTEPKYPPFCK